MEEVTYTSSAHLDIKACSFTSENFMECYRLALSGNIDSAMQVIQACFQIDNREACEKLEGELTAASQENPGVFIDLFQSVLEACRESTKPLSHWKMTQVSTFKGALSWIALIYFTRLHYLHDTTHQLKLEAFYQILMYYQKACEIAKILSTLIQKELLVKTMWLL